MTILFLKLWAVAAGILVALCVCMAFYDLGASNGAREEKEEANPDPVPCLLALERIWRGIKRDRRFQRSRGELLEERAREACGKRVKNS